MNEVFVPEITDSLRKSEWLLSDFPIQFRGVKKYICDMRKTVDFFFKIFHLKLVNLLLIYPYF